MNGDGVRATSPPDEGLLKREVLCELPWCLLFVG